MHVSLHLSALHIKHIDEHLHIAKHIVSLAGEVVLHEGFLSACVVRGCVCGCDEFVLVCVVHGCVCDDC